MMQQSLPEQHGPSGHPDEISPGHALGTAPVTIGPNLEFPEFLLDLKVTVTTPSLVRT